MKEGKEVTYADERLKERKWPHKESSDTLPKIVRQATVSLAYKSARMKCAICQGGSKCRRHVRWGHGLL